MAHWQGPIQNSVKYLTSTVNYFHKRLHLRCLTELRCQGYAKCVSVRSVLTQCPSQCLFLTALILNNNNDKEQDR